MIMRRRGPVIDPETMAFILGPLDGAEFPGYVDAEIAIELRLKSLRDNPSYDRITLTMLISECMVQRWLTRVIPYALTPRGSVYRLAHPGGFS